MKTSSLVCWLFHRRDRGMRGSSTFYSHVYCGRCEVMRDFWKGLRISLRNRLFVDVLGWQYFMPDGKYLYRPTPCYVLARLRRAPSSPAHKLRPTVEGCASQRAAL